MSEYTQMRRSREPTSSAAATNTLQTTGREVRFPEGTDSQHAATSELPPCAAEGVTEYTQMRPPPASAPGRPESLPQPIRRQPLVYSLLLPSKREATEGVKTLLARVRDDHGHLPGEVVNTSSVCGEPLPSCAVLCDLVLPQLAHGLRSVKRGG